MLNKSTIGVAGFCLAFLCSNVNAELVNHYWKTDGDNLITRDTVTNLDWLDLTETNDMSYNDVSAQLGAGGMFEGFRYATNAEVIALWSNNFATDLSAGAPRDAFGPATQGVIDAAGFFGNIWNEYDPGDYDYGVTGLTSTSNPSDSNSHSLLGALHWWKMEFYTENFWYVQDDAIWVGSNIGSYLVSDNAVSSVPVPGAIWLFTSGLLGLISIARHNKAA